MKIVFWGTRGSLPTPLNGRAVKRKLVNALVKGAGKGLDTPEKASAFCEHELSFAGRQSSPGAANSACVQVDTGGPDHLALRSRLGRTGALAFRARAKK